MYQCAFKNIFYPFYESVLRGRKTLTYLAELEKSQWFSTEQLKAMQWHKLSRILTHAAVNIPYYRARFKEVGFDPMRLSGPDDIHRIPFLTKKTIQENQQTLLAENFRHQKLHDSWTGGSTGEPLRFKYDHRTYEMRMAAAARVDRWAGWDYGVKEFYIWGVRPTKDTLVVKWKKELYKVFLRRLLINSYTFSKSTFPHYVEIYNNFRPDVIVAYTSSLYNFARYIHENRVSIFKPKGIITTAEQLYPFQRDLIEKVFEQKLFNRYGSREVMNIAMECDRHQGLHVNIENLYVEILKENRPALPGETGEIVVTDLNNYAMPFIRYKIGDLAVPSEKTCSCGRGLPLIENVAGRTFDSLSTNDGRCVTGLFFTHLMHEFPGVSHFQVIQNNIEHLLVRIVKNPKYMDSDTIRIKEEICKLMGGTLNIDLEFVDSIPLQKSGKQRITISHVPYDFKNQ